MPVRWLLAYTLACVAGSVSLFAAGNPHLAAQTALQQCASADKPADAERAATNGLAAAEQAGDVSLRAKLTGCRAAALANDGKPADAERDYLAAVTLARQAHDTATEAEMLGAVGYLQYNRGAMADALTNLQTAYRLSASLGNRKQMLDDLSSIANVYADSQVAQYDRAIEYYRQLIAEYEKLGAASDVADMVFNIGSTFARKGDFKAAELHYRRALGMFEKLHRDADIAYTKRDLGLTLTKAGRAAEALRLLDEAAEYYVATQNAESVAITRQYRGIAYRRAGRPADALRELDSARAFFEKAGNLRFLEKNAEETAGAYAQLGDWRSAYDAALRRTALQEQLASTRRDEASSRLRVEFDAERKEEQNRALARENALRNAALREAARNEKLQIAVIALTALLAVALGILFWRMRTMALTDELTRLPNRRHILAATDSALGAAKRSTHAAAVIAIDIDRFKWINDTYGHAAGDAVLKKVARACELQLRAGDRIGRIGGEEFLVVLDSATAAQARDVAERLRTAVERLDFAFIDPAIRVTISLGVHLASDADSASAIAAADELLYRAKEGGRNRVEMAETVSAARSAG